MAFSVYSKDLQVFNAEQFLESVSEPANTRIYLTLGKCTPWANDSAPQQANSSVTAFNEVWHNMIGAKLVTGNDIRHVIPRYNWEINQSYAAYDHCACSLVLFDANVNFYVVTSDWNVYKCLSNNNGSISTVMPTTTSVNPSNESDGYSWKYMYTISPGEQLKYTTSNYIPVKTLTTDDNSLQWDVQQAAIPGSIQSIKIVNGGSGYISNNTIALSITGDGTGANAVATINTQSNTISAIFIDDFGSGYTYANVNVISANGSNAQLRAIISPTGGHGSDPLRELGGSYLIIDTQVDGDENGKILADNEVRQIALIKDPYFYGTNTVSSNTVISQLTVLTVSGTSVDYIEDEEVYQGLTFANATFRGVVAQWDSANTQLKLTNTSGIPTADVILGQSSGAARSVSSVTYPDLEPYSGRLLYIDNITPINRSQDQTEDFKIILKF